jgi:nicotinamidase-related amidase
VIDMLSPYDFEDAGMAADGAEGVVGELSALLDEAREAGIRVVYANDLDEDFSGSRERVTGQAASGRRPDLVEPLLPKPEDSFIHKGQHSAFYGTPLAHLLKLEQADEVVLTGQVTEQCVLYTALDAHVRDYDLSVLTDCVLPMDRDLGEAALRMMERNMGARLETAEEFLLRVHGGD